MTDPRVVRPEWVETDPEVRVARPLIPLAVAAGAGQLAGALGGWAWLLLAVGLVPARGAVVRTCLALAAGLAAMVAFDGTAPVLESGPAHGRWIPRSRDGSVGRLEPAGHPRTSAHSLDLELQGVPPRSGEMIEIFSLGRAREPARGPVQRRELRTRSTVRVDAWRRTTPVAPARWLTSAKRALERRLAPIERRAGHPGLLRALVLGDTQALRFDERDLFTRTGTRHLLAISGLHAGLVAMGLALLFGGGNARARPLAIVTTVVLVGWALVSGAAPPVRRAALTLSIARLASWLPSSSGRFGRLARCTDGRSLLALAFLVELVGDPRAVLSPSVQLSFGATAALLFVARDWARFVDRLAPRLTTAWTLLGAGPLERTLRAIGDRLVRGFSASCTASVVATLATLPILWSTFGETSWASIPATPMALPFLAVILIGALLGLAGIPGASQLVGFAADGLEGMLMAFDSLPGTPSLLPLRSTWAVAAVCVSGLWLPHMKRRFALVWLFAALAVVWPRGVRAECLEVHALDVGSGTAIVLRSPGVDALVFDAGSRDRRAVWEAALAPLLASWEVRQVHVVLSHSDLDHRSALPSLCTRTRVVSYAGPKHGWGNDAAMWDGDGAHFQAGDLELELVQGLDVPGNEGSRSLIVRWRGRAVLLSGDAEAEGLAASLEAGDLDGPFDLATLPHHGSETRWLGAFLQRTQAARVWVSGPSEAPVLPDLERRDAPWDATGCAGPLILRLLPDDL